MDLRGAIWIGLAVNILFAVLVSFPVFSAQKADIEVDFQRDLGTAGLAYGTNEFRDLIEDENLRKRSREANTQYVRMWIDQR